MICLCGCGIRIKLAAHHKYHPVKYCWGHNRRGQNHTVLSIRKMRSSQKGLSHPLWTNERKEIMRIKMTGRHFSKETIEKMKHSKPWISGVKSRFWNGGVNSDTDHIQWRNQKHNTRRRIRVGFTEGTFSVAEWKAIKEKYKYFCPACGLKEPEIKLTVDHIIPLSRGGENTIDNIQPLCKTCNGRKHIKTRAYEPSGQLKLVGT